MATTTTIDPCVALDALAYFQYSVLARLNRKFAQLRRLAEILEQLGDISLLIPNLSALLPVSAIDLEVYIRLQQACPFLNLPPATETTLAELRNNLIAAYQDLINGLLNHPWLRMKKVQGYLDKFQSEMNMGMATAINYLGCLQAICNAVGAAGSAFRQIAATDIKATLVTFEKNFVANAGQVLSEGAIAKYQQVDDTLAHVEDLIDVTADVEILTTPPGP